MKIILVLLLVLILLVSSSSGFSSKELSHISTLDKRKLDLKNPKYARASLLYESNGLKKEGKVLTTIAKNMMASYNRNLVKYPYITKILTSGFVGGMGDMLIQSIDIFKRHDLKFNFNFLDILGFITSQIDRRRLLVFTTVSSLYIAPIINFWFNFLNKITAPDDGFDSQISLQINESKFNKVKRAMKMMILDQTIGALVVSIGFFYAFELVK